MTTANWRSIRLVDCEVSTKTRAALVCDHGPAVTLGYLDDLPDTALVRSAQVGRKSVRELREVIANLKVAYPDKPAPAIFQPQVPIDWSLLARAVTFYQEKGYTYVEAPWAVSDDAVAITAIEEWRAPGRMGLGTLVGSAEQSFLHLDLAGKLPKGNFVACTPCFRPTEVVDELHAPYFMKVELYANVNQEMAFVKMLSHVGLFNKEVLTEAELEHLHGRQMDDGTIDIELNGIEIGSYGVRRHGDHVWTYGTGIAEPRFTQARRSIL